MWICEVCGYENEIDGSGQNQVCACCGEALSQERLSIILSEAENERKEALRRQRHEKTQENIRRCHDVINTFKTYWTPQRAFRMASTIYATGICAFGIWLGISAFVGKWSVDYAVDDMKTLLSEKLTMWEDGIDTVMNNNASRSELIWENNRQQMERASDRFYTKGIFGIKPYTPGGENSAEPAKESIFSVE